MTYDTTAPQLSVSFIKSSDSLTVNYTGETHTVLKTDGAYENVLLALKEKRFNDIPSLVNPVQQIKNYSNGLFKVVDNEIFIDDFKVPNRLATKILEFSDDGLPCEPLVAFFKNLRLNPSHRALNELYGFLEANNYPITDNGTFIAYKAVRPDFKDIHSGTFDNSVGNIIKVERNQVDEDCNQTCSNGLHVASFDYAMNQFGNNVAGKIILEVEINPKDVVAVPTDYNQAKMRVCEYKVIGIVKNEYKEKYIPTNKTDLEIYNDKTDWEIYDDSDFADGNIGDYGNDHLADEENKFKYDDWDDEDNEEEFDDDNDDFNDWKSSRNKGSLY